MKNLNAFVFLLNCIFILLVGCGNDDKNDYEISEIPANTKVRYEAFVSDAENYKIEVGYTIGPTNDKINIEIQESPFTYERTNIKVSDLLYISASAEPKDIMIHPKTTVTARIYINDKLVAEETTNIEDENDIVAYATIICGVDWP